MVALKYLLIGIKNLSWFNYSNSKSLCFPNHIDLTKDKISTNHGNIFTVMLTNENVL